MFQVSKLEADCPSGKHGARVPSRFNWDKSRVENKLFYKHCDPVLSFWYSWPLKIVPTGCPKKSVRNYHSTLRKRPEKRRYYYVPGVQWLIFVRNEMFLRMLLEWRLFRLPNCVTISIAHAVAELLGRPLVITDQLQAKSVGKENATLFSTVHQIWAAVIGVYLMTIMQNVYGHYMKPPRSTAESAPSRRAWILFS